MQEDKLVNYQDLDQVLLDAQLRRSADIGLWLRPYLEERRQARSRSEGRANTNTTVQRPVV